MAAKVSPAIHPSCVGMRDQLYTPKVLYVPPPWLGEGGALAVFIDRLSDMVASIMGIEPVLMQSATTRIFEVVMVAMEGF